MRSLALYLLLGLTSVKPQPCDKPTIQDGSISPDSATIVSGAAYTASCDSGFRMTGTATVTCTDGTLSALPTCATRTTYFTLVKSLDNGDPSVSSGQMGLLLYKEGTKVQRRPWYKEGTVCADGFGVNEANAICRDMGYGSAATWTDSSSRSTRTKHEDLRDIKWRFDMMLSEVRCKGENWSSCTHTTDATCGYHGAVFLTCKTGEGCGNKYDEDRCQMYKEMDSGCLNPHIKDSCKWTCDLCPGSESD